MVLALQLAVAHAADAPPAGGAAVQKIGHGEINWSDGYITATGSGAADTKAANVAVARLGAERAAKLDAFRNILETLKGANVTSKVTAGDEMSSNGAVKAKVEGLIKNFKVVDTKYYSDGSVDVVVRVDIKGDLADALIPDPAKAVAVPSQGAAKNTGLIINAKGLSAVPAMSPRVVDEAGNEVYGAAVVTEAAAKENGIAGYVKDMEAAQGHGRVKGTPLVVRAIKLAPGGKTDLVISNADAEKLRDPQSNLSYLSEGKVIIVID
ncbi:MAG: hypothetical protein AB2A00_04695 [Myxococcota bacterium]